MHDHDHVYGGKSDNDARKLLPSMWVGFRGRCPHCKGKTLFRSFLKVADDCSACGEEFHHHRADDLPAYLVIFIIGHIIVAGFMMAEAAYELTAFQHLAIWTPVTIVSAILFLQPVKGAVVGLQWALRMHGFSGEKGAYNSHSEQ